MIAVVGLFALASAIPHMDKEETRAPQDSQFGQRTIMVQNSEEPVLLYNIQTQMWEVPQCDTDTDCENKYTVDPWTCVTWCVEAGLPAQEF